MDRRMKRQAALYMLITIVDECGGCIDVNAGVVRRFYCDKNQVAMVEFLDGAKGLAADLSGDELYEATLKWVQTNHRKFETIKSKIDKKYNDMIQGIS